MHAITLRIPRAFITSRMFRVPSDIIVVGPAEKMSENKSINLNNIWMQLLVTPSLFDSQPLISNAPSKHHDAIKFPKEFLLWITPQYGRKLLSEFALSLSELTEITSCPQNDDHRILTLQGLLHIIFVQNVSHHYSGGLVVWRKPCSVSHQHSHIVTWNSQRSKWEDSVKELRMKEHARCHAWLVKISQLLINTTMKPSAAKIIWKTAHTKLRQMIIFQKLSILLLTIYLKRNKIQHQFVSYSR